MSIPITISQDEIITVVVGIQGPQGASSVASSSINKTAGETLSGHRAVIIADDNKVYYADKDNLAHKYRVLGITAGAVLAGDTATVITFGEVTEPSWNLVVGQAVFLGNTGYLTQTAPTTGFLLKIGIPITPQTLFVDIELPITLT